MSGKNFEKVPVVVLIGGGSKLPSIIKAVKNPKSKFYITLVVSHKKESSGIDLALQNNIPAIYFNLPDFRKRFSPNAKDAKIAYMKLLGWFISQNQYAPKLLVFAGWDLIVDKNFLSFFKCNFGNGYAAINLHPAILPNENEESVVKLPDRTSTPVIKGEQTDVLNQILVKKLTYFGPTVHFMTADYDTGKVIRRDFIKVANSKTINQLREKLLPVEDKILVESINEVISKYLL
jgi:folate-dependent phosphoribosylglycinamide formyltransferase PurN